ncbi:TetR family transcriptional regulator C-terminal domain-containing protein [Pokkaliibacter sp. CJK22405]|uniref:acrylate utilization transcriptional regulator AcuR n=1 Tax=Pokkaliibacter sp. CJK22405 TaxID=3384615 RepID=UPI003984FDB0
MKQPARRGRPPKVRGDDQDVRTALIRKGVELMTGQGFLATGLEPLLSSVGVPKGSFYHYFESKEAFGLAVIEAYGRYFMKRLNRYFEATDITPLARLDAFIESAITGMQKYAFERGCLVGNLGQEVNLLPASHQQALEQMLNDWQLRLTHLLQEAVEVGELAAESWKKPQREELSAFFWIGWEGAVLRARLQKSEMPLRIFSRQFCALLHSPD